MLVMKLTIVRIVVALSYDHIRQYKGWPDIMIVVNLEVIVGNHHVELCGETSTSSGTKFIRILLTYGLLIV